MNRLDNLGDRPGSGDAETRRLRLEQIYSMLDALEDVPLESAQDEATLKEGAPDLTPALAELKGMYERGEIKFTARASDEGEFREIDGEKALLLLGEFGAHTLLQDFSGDRAHYTLSAVLPRDGGRHASLVIEVESVGV